MRESDAQIGAQLRPVVGAQPDVVVKHNEIDVGLIIQFAGAELPMLNDETGAAAGPLERGGGEQCASLPQCRLRDPRQRRR